MNSYPSLDVKTNKTFLSIVTTFVENTTKSFNFGQEEANSLALAAEEIFIYLCDINNNNDDLVTINCNQKKYLIEFKFQFSSKNFNSRAFNITYKVNPNDDYSLNEMGLLIASRVVDFFTILEENNQINIIFSKYRKYPNINFNEYSPKISNNLKIITPENDHLLILSTIILSSDKSNLLPDYFNSPYLLADMFSQGDINARILIDEKGFLAGGLLWKNNSKETVEIFGPFLLNNFTDNEFSNKLVESCLEFIGKDNFKNVLCYHSGSNFPSDYFEIIGEYSGKKVYYRALFEDTGIISWIHIDLQNYIREEYKKHFLPREIIVTEEAFKTFNEYSVISSKLNRKNQSVEMKPLLFGLDFEQNLNEHIKFFISENIEKIIFEIDLGFNNNNSFIPGLIKNGFTPVLIIPYGGKGDLLIMQYILKEDLGNNV